MFPLRIHYALFVNTASQKSSLIGITSLQKIIGGKVDELFISPDHMRCYYHFASVVIDVGRIIVCKHNISIYFSQTTGQIEPSFV